MRNVVDVSSFFLVEATGDSEADRPDHGSDDNTDDHVEMDAESQSSKSNSTTGADHHVFGRRRQVKCCVRAWIQDYCCRCKRIFHKVEDDDAQEEEEGDDDDDDDDEEEVNSEVKKVTNSDHHHHHITIDDDEKEKSRRFWETCLAS